MVPYTHGELVADTLRGFIADLGGGRGRRYDG